MLFRIHNEGRIYFVTFVIVSIIIFPFFPIIGVILIIFSSYIFYFFRDPIRTVPSEDVIVSPADGIVTYIGKSDPPITLQEDYNFIHS